MFNSILFFCFVLLLIPKETRANALVFVLGFATYQFIELADSFLIYNLSLFTDYDTTFYYVLSASVLYVILIKLDIKNKYISHIATLIIALMITNLFGWLMYDIYIDPIYYNLLSNGLIVTILFLLTWSLPGGRYFIKNRYIAMVRSVDSKGHSICISAFCLYNKFS